MRGLFFLSAMVSWSAALAEIGLSIASENLEIANKPVTIVKGSLCIGGDGPILQAVFKNNQLILSKKVVAQNATGAGIRIADDKRLVVSYNPTKGLYERDGWLEYNNSPQFVAKRTAAGYELFAGPAESDLDEKVMLQIADIIYSDEDKVTLNDPLGSAAAEQRAAYPKGCHNSVSTSSKDVPFASGCSSNVYGRPRRHGWGQPAPYPIYESTFTDNNILTSVTPTDDFIGTIVIPTDASLHVEATNTAWSNYEAIQEMNHRASVQETGAAFDSIFYDSESGVSSIDTHDSLFSQSDLAFSDTNGAVSSNNFKSDERTQFSGGGLSVNSYGSISGETNEALTDSFNFESQSGISAESDFKHYEKGGYAEMEFSNNKSLSDSESGSASNYFEFTNAEKGETKNDVDRDGKKEMVDYNFNHAASFVSSAIATFEGVEAASDILRVSRYGPSLVAPTASTLFPPASPTNYAVMHDVGKSESEFSQPSPSRTLSPVSQSIETTQTFGPTVGSKSTSSDNFVTPSTKTASSTSAIQTNDSQDNDHTNEDSPDNSSSTTATTTTSSSSEGRARATKTVLVTRYTTLTVPVTTTYPVSHHHYHPHRSMAGGKLRN